MACIVACPDLELLAALRAFADHLLAVKRNGGRRERRTCTMLGGPSLGSLIRVRAERIGPWGRRQCSVRYYISSRPVDADALP